MSLQTLQADVDAARAGRMDLRTLAGRLRAASLPEELPPRYAEVLADITDRIESSAMFSGESCSFSETDLLEAVQAWLTKARRVAGESAS